MAPQVTTRTQRKVVHVSTIEAYDRWAAVYDGDGNFLQALDSHALPRTMLPQLLENLPSKHEFNPQLSESPLDVDDDTLYITDLGCGTGRATLILVSALGSPDSAIAKGVIAKGYGKISLTGIDASPGMLQVARQRVPTSVSFGEHLELKTQLCQWDMLDPSSSFIPVDDTERVDSGDTSGENDNTPKPAHAIISTLVVEHIPPDIYFERAKELLKPGGVLLVTNMHDEMGNLTFDSANPQQDAKVDADAKRTPNGAGFIDTSTNTKIRGVSYGHSINEIVSAAEKVGFELVGDRKPDEITVEPWMLEDGKLLGERGRKWLGTRCWYGMVFRRTV